jgi:hypothetical protein
MNKDIEKNNIELPLPLFDTLENIGIAENQAILEKTQLSDYRQATAFLKSYNGSSATFNAYRREVERLLHWSWRIAKKSVKELRRTNIESYLSFCQSPPLEWIGTKKVPRFVNKNNQRVPNQEWRPFITSVRHKEIFI